MRHYKGIVFLIICALLFQVQGQDLRFSQYHDVPALTNPAMTGLFNGNCRIKAITRSQYYTISSPYKQLGVTYDKSEFKNTGIAPMIGGFIDAAGDANYGIFHFLLGGAKQFQRGKDIISIGASAMFNQQSINASRLLFDQDGNNFNSNFNPNSNLEFNVGGIYSFYIDKKRTGHFGLAMYNLNRANLGLLGESRGYRRFVMHYETEILLNNGILVIPAFYYTRQKQTHYGTIGIEAIKAFKSTKFANTSFHGGFYFDPHDGFTTEGGLTWNNHGLDLSYDWTWSALNKANRAHGAVELVYTYICRGSKPERPNFKACKDYL